MATTGSASRLKHSQEKALDEARTSIAAGTKHQKAFKKFDAANKIATVTPAFLKETNDLHKAARTAVAASQVDMGKLKRATVAEQTKRDALFFCIAGIRDQVGLVHGGKSKGEIAICRAFGHGQSADRRSTPGLRTLAATMEQNYVQADLGAAAKKAGITPKRMNEVTVLRRDLTAADANQGSAKSERVLATVRRGVLLRELSAKHAFILRAAAVVFRGDPGVLAEFRGKRVNAGGKKRKKTAAKKAPPPATPPTAGGG